MSVRLGRRRLHGFFQKLIASGGLMTGAGRLVNGCCPPAPEPIVAERTIDPQAPMWQALVEMCRANDEVCVSICTALVFGGALPDDTAITACYLRERAADEVLVHTEYVVYDVCEGAGRRPPGLRAGAAPAGAPVARWLAEVAHLEAASVPAFVLLARDLVALGAPAPLVRAALAAADDERRHARTMTALARAHGATPRPVVIEPTAPRQAGALALDNAVEGCVREAFAALCAHHQAAAAPTAALRSIFAGIARDETAHAALSFAIDAWLQPRLDPVARVAIARARAAAFEALQDAAGVDDAVARAVGWPGPARARGLLAGARDVLRG